MYQDHETQGKTEDLSQIGGLRRWDNKMQCDISVEQKKDISGKTKKIQIKSIV